MDRQLIYQSREREQRIKIVLRIIGVFIMVAYFILHKYFKSAVGFVLIILSFYNKEIYIDEENVEFLYRGLFFKHIDLLSISNITDIVIKDKGENTIICLISGYGLKKVIVDKCDSDKVIRYLTKKSKP